MSRYKVSTLLRDSKAEFTTIFITVAIEGTRILRYPSGFKIKTSDYYVKKNTKVKWTGEIKDNAPQNRKLKDRISKTELFIEKYEEDNSFWPSKKEIKDKLDELSNKSIKTEKSIWNDLDKYCVAFKDNLPGVRISVNSQNTRKQLKSKLLEFNSSTCYSDINEDYLEAFAEFLTNKGLSNHSTVLMIRVFKSFLRKLKLPNKSFEDFKLTKVQTTKEQKAKKWALSWEEIKQFQNLKLNKKLDLYRRAFLILTFSCQRFSDYNSIINTKPVINGGGRRVIKIQQQKTSSEAKIPVNSLLEKYLKNAPKNLDYIEFLESLDTISNIMFDGKKKMTTHTARRSGASLYYLKMKLPISVVRTVTGHGSEAQFLTYLDPESVDDTQSILDAFKGLE